jgi:hypothetical protein
MVMKSLPPLNAPRQRMSISSELTNRKTALTMLTPKNKLAAAPKRISKSAKT